MLSAALTEREIKKKVTLKVLDNIESAGLSLNDEAERERNREGKERVGEKRKTNRDKFIDVLYSLHESIILMGCA